MTQIYVKRSSADPNRLMIPAVLFLLVAAGCFGMWLTLKKEPDTVAPLAPETQPPAHAEEQAPVPTGDALPFSAILELEETGELAQAREEGLRLLERTEDPAERMETEQFLGALNTRMLFSRAPMAEKISHVVKAGDTLGELAATYGTTKELIARINGIQNNIIRVGKSLQVLQGDFSAVVDKSSNEMLLELDGRFFKRYPVGTGTDSSTPVGEYEITVRLRHPVWYRPDGESFAYGHPENLLGTHYLKLNTPGIGLHGTWEPETIGSQSSAGCVRFENEMIEELYLILPVGTSITIQD